MTYNKKRRMVFARNEIKKGDIICQYEGGLWSYKTMVKRNKQYEKCQSGSYILKFKFKEKHWAIDATKEDESFGRLINHSKRKPNVKPAIMPKEGVPFISFLATRDIAKDEEILYDYCDYSRSSKENFPWLKY